MTVKTETGKRWEIISPGPKIVRGKAAIITINEKNQVRLGNATCRLFGIPIDAPGGHINFAVNRENGKVYVLNQVAPTEDSFLLGRTNVFYDLRLCAKIRAAYGLGLNGTHRLLIDYASTDCGGVPAHALVPEKKK